MNQSQKNSARRVRVLAVASSGGHWIQLLRMRPAWQDFDVAYLTTEASYKDQLRDDRGGAGGKPPRFYTVVAANRWQKFRLVRQLLKIVWVVLKERPTVICSTGAAPGYFAIRLGKLIGARAIWIDSIANAETMSMAGKKSAPHADVWLTQWENLEGAQETAHRTPEYWGAIL